MDKETYILNPINYDNKIIEFKDELPSDLVKILPMYKLAQYINCSIKTGDNDTLTIAKSHISKNSNFLATKDNDKYYTSLSVYYFNFEQKVQANETIKLKDEYKKVDDLKNFLVLYD